MKAYNIFKEYIWLVQTIYDAGRISFEEISDKWQESRFSDGKRMPRATFNRHRDAIEYIFGLYIECDRKDGNRYYIGNSHVLGEDSVQNWILSTLSVNNSLLESLSVQDRIQIESIPDNRYLDIIIDAMKKGRRIEVQYRRFGAEPKTHTFAPYALKVYQRRWYILGFFAAHIKEDGTKRDAHYTIFSFDRIEHVTITNERFKIPYDFNVKDYFRDAYGIVTSADIPTESVVLRAYGKEIYNTRTLPFHHTQSEIGGEVAGERPYSDFEMFLKPTLDFAGKILSRGAFIEVLKPQWFRDEVIGMHREALKNYGL